MAGKPSGARSCQGWHFRDLAALAKELAALKTLTALATRVSGVKTEVRGFESSDLAALPRVASGARCGL